jgi:glycosyltransferase involved in cell wall biosynthesis
MNKVIVVTNNTLPLFMDNGSSVYLWCLTEALARKKKEVHIICYNFNLQKWLEITKCSGYLKLIQKLEKTGLILHPIPSQNNLKEQKIFRSRIQRVFFPIPSDFYNGSHISDMVNREIARIDPECVIAYTADAIVAVTENMKERKFILIGLIVDLDHLVRKYRRKYSSEKSLRGNITRFRKTLLSLRMPHVLIDVLNKCDKVICSAYHHTKWLENKGVQNIQYFPVTVMDRASQYGLDTQEIPVKLDGPVIISMIGNVNYIATLDGLYFFSRKILPKLKKIQPHLNFEIHIIGGGELPNNLSKLFSKFAWIHRIGYVDDIKSVFNSSSIILVPTSIPLGFRTRIAEAFSYGCCVVTHKSNLSGMPELLDDKNILLAGSGNEFIAKIEKCLTDKESRIRIEHEARVTFEKCYDGKMISDLIVNYCFQLI